MIGQEPKRVMRHGKRATKCKPNARMCAWSTGNGQVRMAIAMRSKAHELKEARDQMNDIIDSIDRGPFE